MLSEFWIGYTLESAPRPVSRKPSVAVTWDTAIWFAFHGPHGAGKRAAGHNDFKIIMSQILFHLDFGCFHRYPWSDR
jgi:hypothetical protein